MQGYPESKVKIVVTRQVSVLIFCHYGNYGRHLHHARKENSDTGSSDRTGVAGKAATL
jgi:hypothetical protein